MFAKLSALALCLSLVSALRLEVPPHVEHGTKVEVGVVDVPDNLGAVDLVLASHDAPAIELVVGVVLDLDIEVYIPAVVPGPGYVIDVVRHDDQANVIGKSNPFDID